MGSLARQVLHKSEKLVESVERLLSLDGKWLVAGH